MKNTNLLVKYIRALTTKFGNSVRFQKLFSIIVLGSVLASAFPVAAQTGRPPVNPGSQGRTPMPTVQTSTGGGAKRPPAKTPIVSSSDSKAACKGGWSGVINFETTLDQSRTRNNKSANGHTSEEFSHKISYEGGMIVDGSDPKAVATRGTVGYSDVWLQHENTVTIDSCHANETHEFVVDDKVNYTQTGNGAGEAESFYLNVNEMRGTYELSFSFPKIPGKSSRETHRRSSGHCQPKNNEPVDFSEKRDIVVESKGGSVRDQKINPSEPDVLTGSVTIDDNDKNRPNAPRSWVTKISWKLRRCPPPLMITDVKFYHLRYPSPNTWEEIKADDYTIDGNEVKIVASIVNLSGAQKSATVNFKELKENADLPQGKVSVNFEPHEERQVEYLWDTSGYAWKEAAPWNQSEIFRQIEVKIPDDSKVEEVEVHPKPVVVISGLWSNSAAFDKFVKYFNSNPNNPWAVQPAPVHTKRTAASNAPIIETTVRNLQEKENAWHVDLVAHSTGGLMARAYVDSLMPMQYDNRPTASHLVMLGTPNMGTPCASGLGDAIARFFNRNPEAFGELSHKNMRVFNEKIKLRHGTKFSILVSNAVTPICQLDLPGDGVVPNKSAMWMIKDWKYSTVKTLHEDMPGDQANFMQVYKWLAISPKGDHAPDNTQASNINSFNENVAILREENFGKFRNYGVLYQAANYTGNNFDPNSKAGGDDEPEPNFATGVKVAANETKEIEIPVTNGSRLSLILYAEPNVSATLMDDKGEIVGKTLAGTPGSVGAFRTISVKKPFQNGKWKLRLDSRERTETEIIITAFIDFNQTLSANGGLTE